MASGDDDPRKSLQITPADDPFPSDIPSKVHNADSASKRDPFRTPSMKSRNSTNNADTTEKTPEQIMETTTRLHFTSADATHVRSVPSPLNLSPANLANRFSTFSTALQSPIGERGVYFRSRRMQPDQKDKKPEPGAKDPREKWVTIIPLIGLAIGFILAVYLVVSGLFTVQHHNYTLVLDENWSQFDTKIWTKESNVGGFGNGEFQQTTSTDENVFIQNGQLHIKPTLQDDKLITENNTLELGADCTGTTFFECNAVTNTTNNTIIPPVKSGRINTKKGATIKYGRVEVTATLPTGDWLWPAIWMMPVNDTYGEWPKSGEIDIMESRGNNWTYAQGGDNIASSALHWGPNGANDAWWRTNNKREALHTTFAKKQHTFGLEWSQKYLYTYINNRLLQVLYTPFTVPFWTRGAFPDADANGTMVQNPWAKGTASTPFDQPFFLIINIAVGGKNGWFEDNKSGKPWVDKSTGAAKDFWNAKDQWLPTWKDGSEMVVSRVQMWQQAD